MEWSFPVGDTGVKHITSERFFYKDEALFLIILGFSLLFLFQIWCIRPLHSHLYIWPSLTAQVLETHISSDISQNSVSMYTFLELFVFWRSWFFSDISQFQTSDLYNTICILSHYRFLCRFRKGITLVTSYKFKEFNIYSVLPLHSPVG